MLARLAEAVVFLLVLQVVWRVIANALTVNTRRPPTTRASDPPAVKLVRDPVCGTYVSPSSALSADGQFFCSEKCRSEYRRRA